MTVPALWDTLSQVVVGIIMDKNTECVMMALGSGSCWGSTEESWFGDGSSLRRLFRKGTLELDLEGSVAVPKQRMRRGRCSWWKEKPM